MVRFSSSLAAAAVVAVQLVAAQTFSECDPTKKSGCPPRAGLNQAEYSIDFKSTKGQGADAAWTNMAKAVTFGDNGAEFSLKALGDSVTYATNFYIFFGYVEVKMRAAPGQGIVSSFVLQSDDLDEIDWEMIGSETDKVQSNYFGKGNTTTYDRGAFHNVQTPADITHSYAINWTQESTTWIIDGAPVRTVKFADALGGQNYPQTPMNLRLGNWIAGSPGNSPGTVQWAGGNADMSKAPFNMYVESVTIKNYNPAAAYVYGDNTGSFSTIKFSNTAPNASNSTVPVVGSNSTASAAPVGSAVAASSNAGKQKAASSSPAAGAKASGHASKPGIDQGPGGNDDDEDCQGMDEPSGGAAPPIGTVTVTPNAPGNTPAVSGSVAVATPSQAIAVVSSADSGAAPSTTLATAAASTSVPAVAAATPSPSAVVSFPLGNGSSVTNTYTPAQASSNDAARRAVSGVLAAMLAGLTSMLIFVS